VPELASQSIDRASDDSPRLRGAGLASVAMAVPDNVVENAVITERLGLKEDWIVTRTGVLERHFVADDESLVDLAAQAGERALSNAGVDASDLDYIIVGTMTHEDLGPNVAPQVAAELGCNAGAFDLGAACTAWLSGLSVGVGLIESERADSVLVIGADVLSRITDPMDKGTAGLLADGAGAGVLQASTGTTRIGPIVSGSDGTQEELIKGDTDTGLIYMKGHDTFKHAVNRMSEATLEALRLSGREISDVDLFVYHQANSRILRAVGERLELPGERVADYVPRFGNTSAATLPIALTVAQEEGRLADGDVVLLSAFGAGLTWAATVIEWGIEGA